MLQLVECPRDAMQGWARFIETKDKIAYLNSLLRVGFHTLDFGSFVSAKAIPQMADTHEVLAGLDLGHTETRLLAIVANLRGAEDAAQYDSIRYLGFPFSLSATFQQRNTNSSIAEAEERVAAIQDCCLRTGKELVLYLSMGFGNPYGDPYNAEILLQWADTMSEKGIRIISLADTVGVATPQQIGLALATLVPRYPDVQFGVHLHSAPHNWQEKLNAAYTAGCRRFDSALKGIGGCPMAQDELVGNMDTQWLLDFFEARGPMPRLNRAALAESLALADTVFRR